MLRIPDTGDYLAASEFFRKGGNYYIGLIVAGGCDEKVIGGYVNALENLDLLGIGVNGHYVQKGVDFLRPRLVCVYYCNGMVASQKGFGNLHSQFSCANNRNFHNNIAPYRIILKTHHIIQLFIGNSS